MTRPLEKTKVTSPAKGDLDRRAGSLQDLLQMLYQNGDLSSTNLKTLKTYIKRWKVRPLRALLDTHVLAEDILAAALARHLRLERYTNAVDLNVKKEVLSLVPFAVARQFNCLPVRVNEAPQQLVVLTADPTDPELVDLLNHNLKTRSGKPLPFVFAVGEFREILRAIDLSYPLDLQIQPSHWRL